MKKSLIRPLSKLLYFGSGLGEKMQATETKCLRIVSSCSTTPWGKRQQLRKRSILYLLFQTLTAINAYGSDQVLKDFFAKVNTTSLWEMPQNGSFFGLSTQSQFWLSEKMSVKKNLTCCFVMKQANSYSEAIDSLINSKTVIDCHAASHVAALLLIRHHLGKNYFDQLAIALWQQDPFSVSIGNSDSNQLIAMFFKLQKTPHPCSLHYITNLPIYFKLHSGGGSGFNVFDLGDETYVSFGRVFNAQPKTYEEIEKILFDLMNEKEDLRENILSLAELTWPEYQQKRQDHQKLNFNLWLTLDEKRINFVNEAFSQNHEILESLDNFENRDENTDEDTLNEDGFYYY